MNKFIEDSLKEFDKKFVCRGDKESCRIPHIPMMDEVGYEKIKKFLKQELEKAWNSGIGKAIDVVIDAEDDIRQDVWREIQEKMFDLMFVDDLEKLKKEIKKD